MMMMYVGIDPGKTGAIALLSDTGDLLEVVDMPLVDRKISAPVVGGVLARLTTDRSDVGVIAVEEVNAMPGQGVTSMFTFGQAHGIVLGAAATVAMMSRGWRLTRPTPQAWKKHHGLIGKEKDASRALAHNLWPHLATSTFRNKTNGRADAALIALYAKENLR